MTHRLLHELTREDARAAAPDTLVLLPVGSVEQHGPHLPLGTDFMTAEHLAREAAGRAACEIPIAVAPTLPFGSSHHHIPFGGTMSLSTETYYRVLYELGSSLVESGFRILFIINGHGGNHEVTQLVARDLALEKKVHAAAASYWTLAWDALVGAGAHVPGRLPGHAGAFETSQMMALRPDLVRTPLPHRDGATGSDPRTFYRPYRVERPQAWQAIDGFSDSPDRADAERGRTYLEVAARELAAALVEFYRETR